jgi:predicted amidohydrolase YtcJ
LTSSEIIPRAALKNERERGKVDGWVVAFGADQTLYEERRGPTRDVLDPLFPDTPVIVFHLSGHAAFMNSVALRLSGLDESTPEPRGGFFEKDKAGRLTGYLSGQPAFLPYKPYPNSTPASAIAASRERAERSAKIKRSVLCRRCRLIPSTLPTSSVWRAMQAPSRWANWRIL